MSNPIETHPLNDTPSADVVIRNADGVEATVRLIDDHGETIATIDEDYVPNAAIPGSYGDYIELEIEADGKITNWKRPSFKEFFRKTD